MTDNKWTRKTHVNKPATPLRDLLEDRPTELEDTQNTPSLGAATVLETVEGISRATWLDPNTPAALLRWGC